MNPDIRLSAAGLRIAKALLSDPSRSWSGAELSAITKTGSGTMYPLLSRWENAGWLAAQWEDVDPKEVGRPRRRLYRLTPLGVRHMHDALSDVQLDWSAKPVGGLAWNT